MSSLAAESLAHLRQSMTSLSPDEVYCRVGPVSGVGIVDEILQTSETSIAAALDRARQSVDIFNNLGMASAHAAGFETVRPPIDRLATLDDLVWCQKYTEHMRARGIRRAVTLMLRFSIDPGATIDGYLEDDAIVTAALGMPVALDRSAPPATYISPQCAVNLVACLPTVHPATLRRLIRDNRQNLSALPAKAATVNTWGGRRKGAGSSRKTESTADVEAALRQAEPLSRNTGRT